MTPDDLLACTTLDVSYPALAIRRILGSDEDELAKLLGAVRPDLDLWDADDDDLKAAQKIWDFLCEYDGVKEVMAGKLMARKRPRLVPVVDSVILGALAFPPGQFWVTLLECLQDAGLRQAIEKLRPAGVTVTTLRLLDVAVWMRGSNSTTARKVRQTLGMDDAPRP